MILFRNYELKVINYIFSFVYFNNSLTAFKHHKKSFYSNAMLIKWNFKLFLFVTSSVGSSLPY